MTSNLHTPVLGKEIIDFFKPFRKNAWYIDATFGRGGHTRLLLEADSSINVLAFDIDSDAIESAKTITSNKFEFIRGSYTTIKSIVKSRNLDVAGAVFDLGVSSPQLDDAERGFSYHNDGPLDMRMNQDQSYSAWNLINQGDYDSLMSVFRKYGNSKFNRQVTNNIIKNRPIETTTSLVDVIKNSLPKVELLKNKHPAKTFFQAIRIHVNDEFRNIRLGLTNAIESLAVSGKLAVISFHSEEDRLVKSVFNEYANLTLPPEIPINTADFQDYTLKSKVLPTEQEVSSNRRARSAILRCLIRNGGQHA